MSVQRSMKMILAAVAMSTSMSTLAVPITDVTVTGPGTTYLPNPPGVACAVGKVCANPLSPANIAAALSGDGNVELNKFGGGVLPGALVTTLSGTFGSGGPAITLSSLVLSDWTANGNALAEEYIQDAWLSLFPVPLSNAQLATGAAAFITNNLWKLVSDPNISYVDLNNDIVDIGLDGLLNANSFLNPLAIALAGGPLPSGVVAQASEVVKVTFGGNTNYLYSFHATPTGYSATDGQSYSGVYDVTVPEPASLWLLGLGLVGLMVSRRR